MKYRRKGYQYVEAEQWILGGPLPAGFILREADTYSKEETFKYGYNGEIVIYPNDWVVRTDGTCWVVKPEVFAELYEKVEEA